MSICDFEKCQKSVEGVEGEGMIKMKAIFDIISIQPTAQK